MPQGATPSQIGTGLRDHGEWVQVGSYGRCWRPTRIEAGWRPYTRGRWGYGDDWRWHQHVRACFATYPSYDPRTDSFVGRDGRWHRCRL